MGFAYIVKICKISLTFPNATTLQNVHGLNVMHVINVTGKIIRVLHLVMIFVFIAKIYPAIWRCHGNMQPRNVFGSNVRHVPNATGKVVAKIKQILQMITKIFATI